mgnify:CR=1 FL=1
MITFLKKKISLVANGLMVVPGTQVHKVVEVFENHFGAVRGQLIPCDASIQLEDVSAELTSEDAAVFRRVVGMCLYLSRDRPDIAVPSAWSWKMAYFNREVLDFGILQ